jgi:hypothetical protein
MLPLPMLRLAALDPSLRWGDDVFVVIRWRISPLQSEI